MSQGWNLKQPIVIWVGQSMSQLITSLQQPLNLFTIGRECNFLSICQATLDSAVLLKNNIVFFYTTPNPTTVWHHTILSHM